MTNETKQGHTGHQCDCRIRVSTKGEPIAYCPLHAAAPDLLAAIKLVLRDRDAGCLREDTCEHIAEVIAKAEGRKP